MENMVIKTLRKINGFWIFIIWVSFLLSLVFYFVFIREDHIFPDVLNSINKENVYQVTFYHEKFSQLETEVTLGDFYDCLKQYQPLYKAKPISAPLNEVLYMRLHISDGKNLDVSVHEGIAFDVSAKIEDKNRLDKAESQLYFIWCDFNLVKVNNPVHW